MNKKLQEIICSYFNKKLSRCKDDRYFDEMCCCVDMKEAFEAAYNLGKEAAKNKYYYKEFDKYYYFTIYKGDTCIQSIGDRSKMSCKQSRKIAQAFCDIMNEE